MAENSSVDTDNDSIECFQNYTASEVFIQGLAGLVDQQDVESMIRAQKQILQRFEKTNEMLSNCNTLSVSRLKVANQQFKNYKQLLIDIKKDLDYTFKKINVLKNKLQTQYPDSVAAASSKKAEVADLKESNEQQQVEAVDKDSINNDGSAERTELMKSQNDANTDSKCSLEQFHKKVEISDSNSSESGEADSHIENTSISTSDTA